MADKIKDDWQHLKLDDEGDVAEAKDTRNYPSLPQKGKSWRARHPIRAKAVDAYLSIGETLLPNSYKKGR